MEFHINLPLFNSMFYQVLSQKAVQCIICFFVGNENLSDGKNAEIVVNEDGINANFRVESSSSSNLLFTDGINNKVGVNTNTPKH